MSLAGDWEELGSLLSVGACAAVRASDREGVLLWERDGSGVSVSGVLLTLCGRDCSLGVDVDVLLSLASFDSLDGKRNSAIDERRELGREDDDEAGRRTAAIDRVPNSETSCMIVTYPFYLAASQLKWPESEKERD